jgi:hypothetical protein
VLCKIYCSILKRSTFLSIGHHDHHHGLCTPFLQQQDCYQISRRISTGASSSTYYLLSLIEHAGRIVSSILKQVTATH